MGLGNDRRYGTDTHQWSHGWSLPPIMSGVHHEPCAVLKTTAIRKPRTGEMATPTMMTFRSLRVRGTLGRVETIEGYSGRWFMVCPYR